MPWLPLSQGKLLIFRAIYCTKQGANQCQMERLIRFYSGIKEPESSPNIKYAIDSAISIDIFCWRSKKSFPLSYVFTGHTVNFMPGFL